MNGREVGGTTGRSRGVGVPRGYGSHAREMAVVSSRGADADQLWRLQHRRELARRYSELMDEERKGELLRDAPREAQLAEAARQAEGAVAVPPLRPQYFATDEHITLGDSYQDILHGKPVFEQQADEVSRVLFKCRLDPTRQTAALSLHEDVRPFSTEPEWRRILEAELGELTSASFSDRELPVGRTTLRYGEILAVAGDQYASPRELDEQMCEGVKANLRGLGARGIAGWWSKVLEVKTKVRSAIIATENTSHFSPGSWAVYARYHLEALLLALERDFEKALAREAFAGHYLTDAFAAGHIRTPRIVLGEKWLGIGLPGAYNMHKEDNTHGLWVGNRAGYVWRASGDGDLKKNPVHQAMIAVALARSARRLHVAFKLEGQRAADLKDSIARAYAPLPKEANPTQRVDPASLTILGSCGIDGFADVLEWLPVDVAHRETPGGREVLVNYPPLYDEDGRKRHGQPRFDDYFLFGATGG